MRAGIGFGQQITVYGEGRSDVVVYGSVNGQGTVFEAKYAKTLDQLGSGSDAALRQIDDQMCAREYEGD